MAGAFDFDQHAARTIANETGQSELRCQAVYERPKAYALNDSMHGNDPAFHGVNSESNFGSR
jgi:hypothetical protein